MKKFREKALAPLESKGSKFKSALTGFTLMELTIVVVIIGVLASIIYPQYVKARELAIDELMQKECKLIHDAEMAYFRRKGTFWPTGGLLVQGLNNGIEINENLNLVMSYDTSRHLLIRGWDTQFKVQLSRHYGYSRDWIMNETSENATCTANLYAGPDWCP